jgi:hypothetical protein
MIDRKAWFLLVVALLLPFKGALAAVGTFCHLGSSQPVSASAAPHGHDGATHHGHADHHGADVAVDHQQPAGTGSSCAVCSAVCGAPPLPAAGGSWDPPFLSGDDRFPPLAKPRASAVHDGLERPPRTL